MLGSKGSHVQPGVGTYTCWTICDDLHHTLLDLIEQLTMVQRKHKNTSGEFADDVGRCWEDQAMAMQIIKGQYRKVLGHDCTRGSLWVLWQN